jgi:hypothetical protein
MLNVTRLFLLALAVLFARSASATCNLIFADVPALTACAQSQGYVILTQAGEIQLLRQEVDYLKEFQKRDYELIETLRGRLFQLQLDVHLLQIRTKPPQSTKPAK